MASWLAHHEKNNAWLVTATGMDAGTIGTFLGGSTWPKVGNQGKLEKALGWPAGTIRQIAHTGVVPDGLIETSPNSQPSKGVGGTAQDAGYVKAPGETVEGGATDDEVLEGIRAMREDMRALREAIERLADIREPGA
ncbi:hypothetical protein ABKW28_13015 [Nocardioides sp. 31GB23]|uniref:hypothetical protein n=1 Tax=Nocardioides sp. 31GB23 TaxID=3156065 RepID=UPI0032AF3B84